MVKQHLKELARRREALSSKAAYVFCFFFCGKIQESLLAIFFSVLWRIRHYSVSFSLYSSLCYWSYEEIIWSTFFCSFRHISQLRLHDIGHARLPWNNDQKLQWKVCLAETGVMKLPSREIWGDQTWCSADDQLVIVRHFPRKHWGSIGVGSTNKTPCFIWFVITSQELM